MSTFFEYLRNPRSIRKFLIALGAALGVLAAALSDGIVSAAEWVQIGLAFGGGIGVFAVPNSSMTNEDH